MTQQKRPRTETPSQKSQGIVGLTDDNDDSTSYGYGLHPQTGINFTPNWTGISTGEVVKQYYFEFKPSSDGTILLPYQCLDFWLNAKTGETNRSIATYLELANLAKGSILYDFHIDITNMATTRERLLNVGDTTHTTIDFESTQNLHLKWMTRDDYVLKLNETERKTFFLPPFLKTSKEFYSQTNDTAGTEEIAPNHTKSWKVPIEIPQGVIYGKPPYFSQGTPTGYLIPQIQSTAFGQSSDQRDSNPAIQLSKTNPEFAVDNMAPGYDSYHILSYTSFPALFLTQPKIPDENNTMKFRYLLKINTRCKYKIFHRPGGNTTAYYRNIINYPKMQSYSDNPQTPENKKTWYALFAPHTYQT